MKRLKVALLGAGYIAQAHGKALAAVPEAELVAVCDTSRSRAEEVASSFGDLRVLASLDELLVFDCDVVHVLLPPFLHEAAIRRLLEAGKSVLVEKPMGLSADECAALAELATARGLRLGVNHNFLFTRGYEAMRRDAASGALGTLDHLDVHWLYALGLIQFGPYDNWILRSEGNLLFEVGSHLCAFAIDLLGQPDEVAAVASHPIDLPGGSRVFRHWNVMAGKGATSLALNLSVAPGQAFRSVLLRGSGALARLDFERDIYWREQARSNSAMFDPLHTARAVARSIGRQGWRNVGRQLGATFARTPHQTAFQSSISNSVVAFYRTFSGGLDSRLDASFGAQVIRLCERIVAAAGAAPAVGPRPLVTRDLPALAPPRVLVIGGTGFIGKRLVERLVQRGVGVRVMSRSLASARLALDGIDVVYHLAKATGQRWDQYVRGDVEPTRVLATAALAHGVKRFIYTGTIDSYDSASARTAIDAATPVDPRIDTRNLYARSKAACEALLQRMHSEQGLPLVILRPGVVIGEGSPPAHWGVGMFHSDNRAQLWGDGDTKLPLVLVDDAAEGLVLALDAPGIVGRTLLLTDEPLLSAREYVQEVEAASGTRIDAAPTPIWRFFALDLAKEAVKHLVRHPNRRTPSYHDWDSRAHRARYDNRDTRALLGWKPAGTREAMVRDGIVAAVRHYVR